MGQGIGVRRAGRRDAAAIAALVGEAAGAQFTVSEAEVLEWLFSKGLVVAADAEALLGVTAWQAENLVAVTDVFALSPQFPTRAGTALLDYIEAEANTLMCEANIVLLPAWAAPEVRPLLRRRGYEAQELKKLHRIWREVLSEFEIKGLDLMVKRLRERMVMVPL